MKYNTSCALIYFFYSLISNEEGTNNLRIQNEWMERTNYSEESLGVCRNINEFFFSFVCFTFNFDRARVCVCLHVPIYWRSLRTARWIQINCRKPVGPEYTKPKTVTTNNNNKKNKKTENNRQKSVSSARNICFLSLSSLSFLRGLNRRRRRRRQQQRWLFAVYFRIKHIKRNL